MRAIIELDVPEWQIGKQVEVFFPDTMMKKGVCELLKEQEIVSMREDKINKCECGETVCRYWHPEFCGFCGRKLLWY